MNKISCTVSSNGDLAISHIKEANDNEIMLIGIGEVFDNIDISRRVVDGEVQIQTYAKITSEELAILINSVIGYTESKILQYGLE